MSSYGREYLEAVLSNKDENSLDMGWFDTVMTTEYTYDSYSDAADFLEGKLDIKDVSFVSGVLSSTFNASNRWSADNMLFTIFDLNYNKDPYDYADLLMQYNEEIGLPDKWEEKLGTYAILQNFSSNYTKLDNYDLYRDFDSDKVADLVNNADYDVTNVAQVEALTNLVYAQFSDRERSFAQDGEYEQTRMFNQIAQNADMDEDVLKAIEANSAGWYADEEELERQFDKVDGQDYAKQVRRDDAIFKRDNKITDEMVDDWKREYEGVLTFIFNKGFTGMEDQRNDSLVIEFQG